MKHLPLILVSLLPLTSCDCLQTASGRVLDKETKQPIDSVWVYKGTKARGSYTDSAGGFMLQEISGGCMGCPPMDVVFQKANYIERRVKLSGRKHHTVYLEKKK